jgi:hypothetical protein
LEFGDGFEVAEGFGFDGFRFGGVEDGVEFLLLFKKGARGLGVVESEVAFLEAGASFELDGQTGGRVNNFGEAELLAVEFGDFGDEVDGVDGMWRGIQQEVGDEEDAALVFDDGEVAFEG